MGEYSRAVGVLTSSFLPILPCLFRQGGSAVAKETRFYWSNRQGGHAALDGRLSGASPVRYVNTVMVFAASFSA